MRVIDFIDFRSITSAFSQNPLLPKLFIAISDLDGNTIASTEWKGVCCNYHRENPRTKAKCIQSDAVLANTIKKGESYAIYSCYNNLTDAAIPIVVEGELIGNLIIGQVFIEPPDLEYFKRQAEVYGFDKEAYLREIQQVPVVQKAELISIMQFYAGLTSMMGSIALQAHRYKELSDQIAARTAQLEYVNSELEAFTYSVSHDLRAPLRHISGYIDLFEKKCSHELTDQGKSYFDAITDSTKQMGRLLDDLLQFCRNGRVEMMKTETDMNQIVRNCVKKQCENEEEKRVDIQIEDLPGTFCDSEMLKLAWYNLIDNAFKFTRKTEHARIQIGGETKCESEYVYFIKDNGVGFDMKYADKLFGVFQRLHSKDQFEGTGIGLATVKRIIARHGGRIWAEAEPDRGAAFFFTLPRKVKQHD